LIVLKKERTILGILANIKFFSAQKQERLLMDLKT
jgi:hypothetical protein